MSTSDYAVSPSSFTEAIYVGRLNAKGDAFVDKKERTDMVLAAVAEFVQQHYGGGMVADFPGLGIVLDVKVRPIDEERRKSHKNGPLASEQGEAVPEGHEDATSARGADL